MSDLIRFIFVIFVRFVKIHIHHIGKGWICHQTTWFRFMKFHFTGGGKNKSNQNWGITICVMIFTDVMFMSHITNRCLKYKPQIPTLFLVLLTTIKRCIWSVHKTFVAFESSLIFMQKKNKICFCYLSKCYFPQDRPDQIKRYNKRTGTSFLLLRKIESGSKKIISEKLYFLINKPAFEVS